MKWTIYSIIVAFATYWLVNLLLWYPWSYNPILGITLMFVAITPIWFIAVYNCLRRHPGNKLVQIAIYSSLIFSIVAVVLDYIFYGLIRGAMTELYHPTTLYGYAFLISLPFIEILLLKKKVNKKTDIKPNEPIVFGAIGLASVLAIICIVIFDIRIPDSNFKFISMIIASLIVFNIVIWIIIGTAKYKNEIAKVFFLSLLCVVVGMLLGKYGAGFGIKWWIYYPIPVMLNLLLPPIILRLKRQKNNNIHNSKFPVCSIHSYNIFILF